MFASPQIRTIWLDEPQRIFDKTAVTIGSFDGIHRGHKIILEHLANAAAKRNLSPILLTFDPHPRLVLSGDISVLTTVAERELLLRKSGLSCIVHIRFTQKIANLSHSEFVAQYLVQSLGAKYVIVGYDHHFGKSREGSPQALEKLGAKYDFDVEIIPPIKVERNTIKSSVVRKLLVDGKLDKANSLLGHSYIVMGKAVPGRGLGHHIGYPTANLELPAQKLLPPDGVYGATAVVLPNKIESAAMVYIGHAPTFDLPKKMFEVHIFDHDGSALYGRNIVVRLHKFIRSDRSFKTVDELRRQIDSDAIETKEALKNVFE